MTEQPTWGSAPTFTAPSGWREYYTSIRSRSLRLIDLGIWEGIAASQLERWLKNFQGDEEKYFSACVLDSLIYRNETQSEALMRDLFERRLPERLDKVYMPYLNWLSNPHGFVKFHAAIIPVISLSDPPTKSGPVLARLYRRKLSLQQNKMIWPWNLRRIFPRPKLVIFIDDFLGSGNQFVEFAKEFGLDLEFKNKQVKWVYAPLVAHAMGMEKLNKEFPDLQVISSEILLKNSSLFSPEKSVFADQTNTLSGVKSFYDGLIKRSKIQVRPRHRRGYHDMGLAYAFSHATPDNNLPILRERSSQWEPLLEP